MLIEMDTCLIRVMVQCCAVRANEVSDEINYLILRSILVRCTIEPM